MKYVMQKLVKQIDMSKIRVTAPTEISNLIPHKERMSLSQAINHAWLWPVVGQWLQENDIVITET